MTYSDFQEVLAQMERSGKITEETEVLWYDTAETKLFNIARDDFTVRKVFILKKDGEPLKLDYDPSESYEQMTKVDALVFTL